MTCVEPMECGHPHQCWDLEEEECRWCAQVFGLNSTITTLTDCINKRAIIIYEGELTLIAKEIGLVTFFGGTINHYSGDLSLTLPHTRGS